MRTEQADLSDAAFRAALRSEARDPAAGMLVGLEHEYRLLRDDAQIDFRDIIHSLPVPGRRLDPADSNAYRLTSGLALTCDDAEAEIASPPIPVAPGVTGEIERWASAGHDTLAGLLPTAVALAGYSTHLSISTLTAQGDQIAALFASTFAPALMLLFDSEEGLGVYVRPRPGRLEVCSEYATGPQLRSAALFAVGAVRACARALDGEDGLPPLPQVKLLPATSRFGYFVGRRTAFGFDLYRAGRSASIPLAEGRAIGLQAYLEAAWRAARAVVAIDAREDELALVDRIVGGSLPLGVHRSGLAGPPAAQHAPAVSPFGRILDLPKHDGLFAEAVAATWDLSIFRVSVDGSRVFASIPRSSLGEFLEGWSSGRLDDVFRARLNSGPSGRSLTSRQQATVPDLWDAVQPWRLLPEERAPDGAFVARAKKSGVPRTGKARVGKSARLPLPPRTSAPPPPDKPPGQAGRAPPPIQAGEEHTRPWPWKPALAAAAIVTALVVTAGAAWDVVPSSGSGPSEASPTPIAAPMETVTPAQTRTPVATETPAASPTATAQVAPAAAVATPRPATLTPTAVAETPTSSPALDPSRTATPSCGEPGALCTATPLATPTVPRTPEVTLTRSPTPPPSPMPCINPGGICPTATPTQSVLPSQ